MFVAAIQFQRLVPQFLVPHDNLDSDANRNQSLLRLDQEAIVEQTIRPGQAGRVRYHSSWWFARCKEDVFLHPGDRVYVVDRMDLTLIVEPPHPRSRCQQTSH